MSEVAFYLAACFLAGYGFGRIIAPVVIGAIEARQRRRYAGLRAASRLFLESPCDACGAKLQGLSFVGIDGRRYCIDCATKQMEPSS